MLPAYTMAPNARHIKLLRAVIRVDHSMSLIEKLISHIQHAVLVLNTQERAHAAHFDGLRARFQPHRLPTNPHRLVKVTSTC